jgi:hypothetical protein
MADKPGYIILMANNRHVAQEMADQRTGSSTTETLLRLPGTMPQQRKRKSIFFGAEKGICGRAYGKTY